ncbi:DNA-binding protein [Corallococcus sp. AB032C]|uniref:helix-turn-helix domain-containing protein n=1 Tax=Corallococcus TaxID=83461 RepID=UPI000EEDEFA9|nr:MULTISPECIES: helix-turn-helix domain-containing protein [Corallococcus]NPC50965.1 helix-turn-helix domain-containing protein [Corallococcus exiguus]RKH77612.1 DNA-binding protein [Corallococcus sp. AB032C]
MSEPSHALNAAPDFLTVDEAAELLRVNRKTLYEAIRLGQVPGVVRLGRCVRLSRATMLSCSPGQGGPALKEKQS